MKSKSISSLEWTELGELADSTSKLDNILNYSEFYIKLNGDNYTPIIPINSNVQHNARLFYGGTTDYVETLISSGQISVSSNSSWVYPCKVFVR